MSQSVGSTVREQTSVTWGLNLYGQGEFARNPFFPDDPTRRRPPVEIAPGTEAGSKVQEYSEALWHHYQSLAALLWGPSGSLTHRLRRHRGGWDFGPALC